MFDELIYYCYGTETEQIRINLHWLYEVGLMPE